jgi:hypothetical protein
LRHIYDMTYKTTTLLSLFFTVLLIAPAAALASKAPGQYDKNPSINPPAAPAPDLLLSLTEWKSFDARVNAEKTSKRSLSKKVRKQHERALTTLSRKTLAALTRRDKKVMRAFDNWGPLEHAALKVKLDAREKARADYLRAFYQGGTWTDEDGTRYLIDTVPNHIGWGVKQSLTDEANRAAKTKTGRPVANLQKRAADAAQVCSQKYSSIIAQLSEYVKTHPKDKSAIERLARLRTAYKECRSAALTFTDTEVKAAVKVWLTSALAFSNLTQKGAIESDHKDRLSVEKILDKKIKDHIDGVRKGLIRSTADDRVTVDKRLKTGLYYAKKNQKRSVKK